jgi:hypothetical protein
MTPKMRIPLMTRRHRRMRTTMRTTRTMRMMRTPLMTREMTMQSTTRAKATLRRQLKMVKKKRRRWKRCRANCYR